MELPENLQKATILKSELDKLRPLLPEQEKRIMQKFRLDWNYHSSHIEGNSLTYGEMKALILFGHTAQAKPLKDHLEMSGHDEAIKYIEDIIKLERPLTESFIQDLHKLILKQPYQVDAITPDGQPTKRWVSIGSYKSAPNHVKTKTGEIFYFASPQETPAKMADLLKWYSIQIEKKDIHPVIFATEFHYRFIRIHPFDDGNGRIARLLMNFILMQLGYPPAIIKTESKNDYYNALEQADAGQLDFFFNYICDEVNNSLGLMLRGARGEEIEEHDDLNKKIQMLKQKIGEDPKAKVTVKKSESAVKEIVENSILPFIESVEIMIEKFDSFYKSRYVISSYERYSHTKNNIYNAFIEIFKSGVVSGIKETMKDIFEIKVFYSGVINPNIDIQLKGINLFISFHDFVYEIEGSGLKEIISRPYHKVLSKEEIDQMVHDLGDWQYTQLEELIRKE